MGNITSAMYISDPMLNMLGLNSLLSLSLNTLSHGTQLRNCSFIKTVIEVGPSCQPNMIVSVSNTHTIVFHLLVVSMCMQCSCVKVK